METVARVFDAHAGIGADRALIEDRAERYYLWLGDRARGLVRKYRINFFEVLERVIKEAPKRFAKYQQAPETLLKLQFSEAYSLKFILDVAAVVICGFAAWFSIISIRAGVGWGGPAVLAKGIVAALVTVALIVSWQILRRSSAGRRHGPNSYALTHHAEMGTFAPCRSYMPRLLHSHLAPPISLVGLPPEPIRCLWFSSGRSSSGCCLR